MKEAPVGEYEMTTETETEVEDGIEVVKTKTYSDGVLVSESVERRAAGEAEQEAKAEARAKK
jgi:hypothetical protein